MKKPFELILSVAALVGTGSLGLIGVYMGNIESLPLQVILLVSYGILHPALAYGLWTVRKGALSAGKVLISFFLLFSFFQYQYIEPLILILNSLVYAYTLLYLVRPDITAVFKGE